MEWPYGTSGPIGSPPGISPLAGTQGQYPSNNVGSFSSPATASFPGTTQIARGSHPSNGGANNSYASLNARHDHNLGYIVNPNDQSFDSFAYTSSQYQSQAQDTQTGTVPYGTQEYSRNWSTSGLPNRWTPMANLEQDYSVRYATQNHSYTNPSIGPALDGTSLFPSMSSMFSSLPASMSSNRVLPPPSDSLAPPAADKFMGPNQGVVGDSTAYISTPGTISKASVPWLHERTTTGGSQNPVGAVLGSNAHLVRVDSNKSSSSASESQEQPFGYVLPVQQTPSRNNSPFSADYTPTNPANSTIALDNQLYPGKPSYLVELSSNNPLSSGHNASTTTTNLYTYSTSNSSSGANRGSQSSSSGGTLSNGQPYTKLRQPQPSSTLQLEDLRRNSVDRSSSRVNNHRPSVSSAGGTTKR